MPARLMRRRLRHTHFTLPRYVAMIHTYAAAAVFADAAPFALMLMLRHYAADAGAYFDKPC